MSPHDDAAPHELVRRVRDAPETVDVAEILSRLENDTDRETGAEAVLELCESVPDDRPAVVADLARRLDDGDVVVTSRIAFLLAVVAREYPDDARAAVPALTRALDATTPVSANVLRALAAVADAEPEAVIDVLPAVESHLSNEPLPVCQAALAVVARVADADPTAVEPFVPGLVDAATDGASRPTAEDTHAPGHVRSQLQDEAVDAERLRQRAASTLLAVTDRDPEAVVGHLAPFRSVLDPDVTVNPHLRETVLELLETVADARPSAVTPFVDGLVDVLLTEDRLPALQANAARTLAVLADADGDAVADAARPAIPTLGGLLDADDPDVRSASAGLLSYLAEHHPNAVGEHEDELVALLDDDYGHVRGSAVWALGYVGTDDARDALRETVSSDPDGDVRAVAREVLGRTADE